MSALVQTSNKPIILVTKRNKKKKANVVVVSNGGSNSNNANTITAVTSRTLRNRRRRQKRNQSKSGPVRSVSKNSLYSSYGDGDVLAHELEKDVNRQLQTLFFPNEGIFRGTSYGLEQSAITSVRGSIDVAVNGAVNQFMSFALRPSRASQANTFVGWNVSNVVFPDPFGAGSSVTAGPFFTTNPSVSYRVVSAQLLIIPAGAWLGQSGEGAVAYVTQYSSVASSWGSNNRSFVDNLTIMKPWNGKVALALHWVPTEDDNSFDADHTLDVLNSALIGYLQLPAATVSFRFEWNLGIEYLPSVAFRPFVEKKAPKLHPDCWHFVNTVVIDAWDTLMISDYKAYQELSAIHEFEKVGNVGGHVVGMGSMGTTGIGLRGGPTLAAVEEEDFEEVTTGQKVCNVINNMTGLDVCNEPLQSFGKVGMKAGKFLLKSMGGPSPMNSIMY